MFGGVYLWCAIVLTVSVVVMAVATHARRGFPAPGGWPRLMDVALVASLGGVLVQLIPLPVVLVRILSPAREKFLLATSLQNGPPPAFLPLTIDASATVHAWLSLFSILATFWIARALFSRGGVRTFSRSLPGARSPWCSWPLRNTRRARRSCTASGVLATRGHGRWDPSSIATTSEPGACWRSACASAIYSGEPRT